MSSSRQDLLDAMAKYSDEIGVANYITESFAGSATLPGDILVWAARCDSTPLREAKEKLQPLLEEYKNISESEYDQLATLESRSDGQGPDAFVKRWRKLCRHIRGNEDITGLYGYLKKLLDDMDVLADGVETLQSECAKNVKKLDGLRDDYCNALIDVGAGRSDDVGSAILTYSGTGATFGSVLGVPGTVLGAMFGGLVAMISDFNEASADAADSAVAGLDDGDIEGAVKNMSADIEKILNPNKYGEIDGVLKWDPLDDGALDGEWTS